MNAILLGVLGYVALTMVIGVIVSRRIRNESDYLLAGRNLGYALVAFSIFATWFGAETCVSSAGGAYDRGLTGASAEPFGYGLCLLLMGLVFAVPLWKRKLTTLADLFQQRYSKNVERFAVLLMVPASILWAAAQIRAFGQVLDSSSGVGVTPAITFAAVAAITYTVFGGLRASVITDLVQGLVLIGGLVVLFFVVTGELGGIGAAWGSIESERLNLFSRAGESFWMVVEKWSIPIFGSVMAQEIVARVLAARSPEIARRATLMGGSLYLLIGMIPVFIGLVGFKLLPGLDEPEQILPLLAQEHLSTLLYILFAGALVSAILSTVDSTLLAASALLSHNVIVPLRPAMDERIKVRVARIGVIVCGSIAYLLAMHAGSIYELIETASAFGSAGIFVIAVFGLFTRFGGARSAVAALALGAGVWLGAEFIVEFPYAYILSLASAFTGYCIVGLLEDGRTPAGWIQSLGGSRRRRLPPRESVQSAWLGIHRECRRIPG